MLPVGGCLGVARLATPMTAAKPTQQATTTKRWVQGAPRRGCLGVRLAIFCSTGLHRDVIDRYDRTKTAIPARGCLETATCGLRGPIGDAKPAAHKEETPP